MFDLKTCLIEFDSIMSETIQALISECSKIYDDEIVNVIATTLKRIRSLITNTSHDSVYTIYPFKGLDAIFDLNIKAVDEIERLVYYLKSKDYYSVEINFMLGKLLGCEKDYLVKVCSLYVPTNKQNNWHTYAKDEVNKRNLLKGIAYNFYDLAVSENPEVVLYNVFKGQIKDEYKVLIMQSLLDYHYNGTALNNKLCEILKLKVG